MPNMNADILRRALDAQGVTDPMTRAGLAAIAMGESKMQGFTETGYAHTSNDRIREVFGSRVADLDDDQLDRLKSNDRNFFNLVYGAQFQNIHHLGNKEADDGFNFRGRGFIQLTGRANYTTFCTKIRRLDVLKDPDLANDPEIAAQLAVAYILARFHGGGFEKMMASVGNNTPDIAATKRAFFDQFMASGEFAPDGAAAVDMADAQPLQSGDDGAAVAALQRALISAGFSCGPGGDDADFGDDTEKALVAFQAARGLPVTRVADRGTCVALGLIA